MSKIKIKAIGVCKAPDCKREFKKYKSTDKYCPIHVSLYFKVKNPVKTQKTISKFSLKKKKESYIYSKKRKTFLALPENEFCIVAKEIFNEILPAVEVHHKAGRTGNLYLFVPNWLAVSRKGHFWIHQNPKEAYEKGFLIHSSRIN